MNHLEKIKKEFEEKFVFRPFEPDGDWSWNYDELTPYKVEDFITVAIESILTKFIKETEVKEQTGKNCVEWTGNGICLYCSHFNLAIRKCKSNQRQWMKNLI